MRCLMLCLSCATLAIVSGQPAEPLKLGGSSCPANEAFPHNGFYYQFFDCLKTWEQAEATCKRNMIVKGRQMSGGHLVSVLNQDEQDWLKFQIDMRYGSKVGVWLGIKRASHPPHQCPDLFTWTDGNKVVYKNFMNGQPNCRWPGEDCLHLIDNEHWNDAECEGHMRFICKIKLLNFDLPGGDEQ